MKPICGLYRCLASRARLAGPSLQMPLNSVWTRIGEQKKNNEKISQKNRVNETLVADRFTRVNHFCQVETLARHSGRSACTRNPTRRAASDDFGVKVTK